MRCMRPHRLFKRIIGLRPWQLGVAALSAAPFAMAEPAAPEMTGQPLGTGDVFQMLGGLALVLAAIFVLAWAVRRFGRFGLPGGGALRVVAAISMGARERVVLLQAGEQQILIGVAPGRVQTLHVLDEPVAVESQAPGQPGAIRFADRLRQAAAKGRAAS